jgi:hypothetical protein
MNPLRSYDMFIICRNTDGQYRGSTQSSQKVVITDKEKVLTFFQIFDILFILTVYIVEWGEVL